MERHIYITTSWDDGYVLDLRIADLLAEHHLQGTFYIPKMAERGVMSAPQIREIAAAFEVGAHTLHHVELPTVDDRRARQEIHGSKAWLEDITGKPCLMFCFPRGRFQRRHLSFVREAGYVGARSVELVSLDCPRLQAGLAVMPTTVQVYTHPLLDYLRNFVKRRAYRNLWMYVRYGRSLDWPRLARSLYAVVRQQGGVFHLWGHSWEIEDRRQWQRLEEVFAFLGQFREEACYVTNSEVCRRVEAH